MKTLIYTLFIAMIAVSCSEQDKQQTTSNTGKEEVDMKSLQEELNQYVATLSCDIGLAVIGPDSDTVVIHGHKPYRMMSVAKFPQALMLLKLREEGKLSSDFMFHVTAKDMKQRTSSTISKDHPTVPFDLSIEEALAYSVGQSDNVTSNMIFDADGGPQAVTDFIHSLGIHDIGMKVDYWHLNDSTAYYNWSTPLAMATLLEQFYQGKILSKPGMETLRKAMTEGPSGPRRLKAKMPEGVVVAHKTGTGNTDDSTGRIMALNDVGIIIIPDGRHISMAVMISDSFMTFEATEDAIAEIAGKVLEHYQVR